MGMRAAMLVGEHQRSERLQNRGERLQNRGENFSYIDRRED